MVNTEDNDDNFLDAPIDREIAEYVRLDVPRSFFLFAGAGSGKTRSLTETLKVVLEREHANLRIRHQQVGVITYTNAACREIQERIQFNSLIEVSTIHSFVWSQIGKFTVDIRKWLIEKISEDIVKLHHEESKGRAGTRASLNRQRRLVFRTARLELLGQVRKFVYNPDGENSERESLDHNEVIDIGSFFLTNKPVMQRLLVSKFPILLIDESQDTHKALIDALFAVQAAHKNKFLLGLFGDTMQRIYGHGKPDLGVGLPDDWARPVKIMNHRCPRRVVDLINRVRADADGQAQRGRADKEEGVIRLFIARGDDGTHEGIERRACSIMARLTGDDGWSDPAKGAKTLTLEHHMAARRLGFLAMFEALGRSSRLRTGLLDGTLPGLRLFSHHIFPVIEARKSGNEFGVAAILRKHSPLVSKQRLIRENQDQLALLKTASIATDALVSLCEDGRDPTFFDVLESVLRSGLFSVPESLRLVVAQKWDRYESEDVAGDQEQESEEEDAKELNAWNEFIVTAFSQISPYREYVSGNAIFGTQQGVKGLEFPRVMVILDDSEARGFLFQYEKLFGVADPTPTDLRNQKEGKETSIDRTRRLLYVTCSRAQNSLALILYTGDTEKARQHVTTLDWFSQEEIEIIDP